MKPIQLSIRLLSSHKIISCAILDVVMEEADLSSPETNPAFFNTVFSAHNEPINLSVISLAWIFIFE